MISRQGLLDVVVVECFDLDRESFSPFLHWSAFPRTDSTFPYQLGFEVALNIIMEIDHN